MSLWQPSATHAALAARARLNRLIRAFFDARGVLEVETPLLSAAGTTEPNIESLPVDWPTPPPRRRWLRTSPEHAIKRLLAAGIGDCYELGRVFRAGEFGRRHNPEFTLLEWYRLGFNHHRLADEVVELVQSALALEGRSPASVTHLSYRELFQREAGIDPFTANEDQLAAALAPVVVRAEGLGRDDWLDLILTHRIEPRLAAAGGLVVVTDFPASQCALARLLPESPPRAARFEVYLNGIELANGYHELRDPTEQRQRFAADLQQRAARRQPQPAIDERLLAALDAGLPDCAGVALGVDRLLLCLLGAASLAEVIAFPADRA